MIVNRAHGEPVSELERLNFDLARSDGHFTLQYERHRPRQDREGEVIEDAELDEPPALPPGDS
jgi:hypothetical protein